MKLEAKVILTGKIEAKTGLHIGGNKETLDIGGIDNPVIKVKNKNGEEIIYIPGSSLKGKIRSLLEKVYGRKNAAGESKDDNDGTPCECGDCDICKLFGPHNSEKLKEPVRVIVRDAYLEDKDIKTEEKVENIIDRVKGTAQPRRIERVPVDSNFSFEIIFNVYNKKDKELFKRFVEGMKLLEDDYLGGSGSRGYGKVEFKNMKLVCKPKEFYEKEEGKEEVDIYDLSKLSEEIGNLKCFAS